MHEVLVLRTRDPRRRRRYADGAILMAAALITTGGTQTRAAVTPQSPEVQALVKKGLRYLDDNSDARLGGKCVIGLAYLKTSPPQPNHPRVKEALAACQAARNGGRPLERIDMYSNGLAIIFLAELNPKAHKGLIDFYLGLLKKRQKSHGGWGYEAKSTGDTSQTQYAALSYWEAHNNGFKIEAASSSGLADWLIGTQDPGGGWGYQGKYSDGEAKKQERVTCSMVAAAMGSALITLDLFGYLNAGPGAQAKPAVAGAFNKRGEQKRKRAPRLQSASYARERVLSAVQRGDAWMDENFKISIGVFNVYYLYSLERFKSFQEEFENDSPDSPGWYQEGYEWLKEKQNADGSWSSGCGPGPDTAFAILFLVRSTKQLLNKPIIDSRRGMRGFPKSTVDMEFINGQFVRKQTKQSVDNLLAMLGDDQSNKLDAMADDPNALIITGQVDETAAARLSQIVRSGSPSARLLATRTLGRTGDMDHVPTLIYALTDPDRRVVLAARNALRFTSRRFTGFGLKDNFEPRSREVMGVADLWKRWYLSIRPDAIVPLN